MHIYVFWFTCRLCILLILCISFGNESFKWNVATGGPLNVIPDIPHQHV